MKLRFFFLFTFNVDLNSSDTNFSHEVDSRIRQILFFFCAIVMRPEMDE